MVGELGSANLKDISQIQTQFEELLGLADPWLGSLAQEPSIRAAYRKLVEHYEQCSSAECKIYYADSLLSLGLLMRHKGFMQESVLKAAAALKGSYPAASNLGEIVVNQHLMPLMSKLSEKHSWLSSQDLVEFKSMVDAKK